MKSLYCIAGILPAQFRSSQVDCGIGWKEHVKQEPRKAKAENSMSEINLPSMGQPPVCFGIDPAAEPKPSIDFSTIKPGDKVMLVDGKTFTRAWARDFTKNKVYEVYEVDTAGGMSIRLINDIGYHLWVYDADIRPISFEQTNTNTPNPVKAKL